MKSTEWFVTLNSGNVSFLIPQNQVIDSFTVKNGLFQKSSYEISFGKSSFIDFDSQALNFISSFQECSIFSTEEYGLVINAGTGPYVLKTALLPVVKNIYLKDFFIPEGILKNYFTAQGIEAVCFEKDVVQYLINLDSFLKQSKSEN